MKLAQCIPGTLCNQKLWQYLAPELKHSIQLQHVSLDHIETEVAALRVIKKASCISPHIIGFSMGGYYGLAHAIAEPKLKSLVVIGAHCHTLSGVEIAHRRRIVKNMQDMRHVNQLIPPKRLEKFICSSSTRYEKVADVIRLMEQDLGLNVLKRQLQASFTRQDLTERLAEIQCPVLLIAGEKDKIIHVKEMEAVARGIPNSQLHVLPNVGHMMPLEAPVQTASLIRDFYDLHYVSESSQEKCLGNQ